MRLSCRLVVLLFLLVSCATLAQPYPARPIRILIPFTPVALVGESPNALVTHPRVPANSIKDLIALAKAKPGQLNYGSSGAGTTVHLSAELFSTMTGIKMVHVPFKGASEALGALLGYAAAAWFGIVGPAGIPKPVVAMLNKATLDTLNAQEVKDRLFASGVEVRTSTPEEFARYIESEMQKWAKVVKASGARAD